MASSNANEINCLVEKHDIDITAANLPTNIVHFRGFDSIMILILRAGIPRPIGNFLESSSQEMLVGIMLVGRLGVQPTTGGKRHGQ